MRYRLRPKKYHARHRAVGLKRARGSKPNAPIPRGLRFGGLRSARRVRRKREGSWQLRRCSTGFRMKKRRSSAGWIAKAFLRRCWSFLRLCRPASSVLSVSYRRSLEPRASGANEWSRSARPRPADSISARSVRSGNSDIRSDWPSDRACSASHSFQRTVGTYESHLFAEIIEWRLPELAASGQREA
jgi:hypothetical protein